MSKFKLDLLTLPERLELEALLAEQDRRTIQETIRNSFEAWCRHALAPYGQTPAPHHLLAINELQKVADGETHRLMLCMPPGSAKSRYASVLFPPWMMARCSGFDIIGASNTTDLAERFSREALGFIRDNSTELGYGLMRDTAQDWSTTQRGAYRATGIGGAIAGRRADLALIDDPVKSREDVQSAGNREKQWNWFTSDLRTRLKPNAAIIVIMTRWHPDDLGGRLLDRQPGLWRVVSLPAIADENDPLGRAPGEWLWDGDPAYGYGAELRKVHAELMAAGATRDWSALYQQKPTDQEGSLFKVVRIGVEDVAPVGGQIVRAWDLAATKQIGTRDPDWTVGVKLQRTPQGRYIVLDVVRFRGGPDDVQSAIVNTAKQDGHAVKIGLPQDPGQAGKTQVLYLTRALAGFTVESSPETGDKETRAGPAAAQVNGSNFAMVKAPWNAVFLDELAAFPGSAKDDQVDALSRAFSMVALSAGAIRVSADAMAFLRSR